MPKAQELRGYALAVFATLSVVGARALLGIYADPPPFITFFPAILISGWWGGRGPAVLCVLLCALASAYFWLYPPGLMNLSPPALLNLVLFLIVGATLAFMSAAFRRARDRAESARQQLERFFASTGDAVMAFDDHWRYIYVNPRAARFAKRAPEEMVGRSIFDLFPDIATVPFFHAADRVMRERVPASVESYYAPLDTWFENDIYPIDDGISVFYRDVTERRRAVEVREELLRHAQAARSESETANRLKDEFLATLSHELRTPLNAITGWATLLGEDKLSPADRARAVDAIQRNARAQTHLVEDLLDVSRIISGKLRLDVQAVDLYPLLIAALESVRPAADAKEIRLQVDGGEQPAMVTGDPARLQQIAWNLLSNAIKFTPHGGHVELALRRTDSDVLFTVVDSGIGIAPHMLQRIFDRFTQADSTSTRAYHGLGLGLALVRHLVEAHGGSVEATSPGEGMGATFTVCLPLRLSHDVERGTKAGQGTFEQSNAVLTDPTSLSGLAVLVVDDDREARELLVSMLSMRGAVVTTASSASEALSELDADVPDVLLSDIEMPGEDGYSLIRRVRGRRDASSTVPAIAITAYARPQDRARALRDGFDEHLAKPVTLPELQRAIARLRAREPRTSDAR
jgi:signal transduction histidine kinase/ActR/RegA family two-component response regulator